MRGEKSWRFSMTTLPVSAPIEACWSKTGVWGEGNCPQLSTHVHCRNCPTYAAAANQLLDAPLPTGYVEEWTGRFARATPAVAHETQSAVIFRLHSEWVGLPVDALVEVVE